MKRFLFIVLAACGGGSKSEPTLKQAAPASCGEAATGMLSMMNQDAKDTVEEFKKLIANRCERDAWASDAKQCLSTMKTRTDAERCSTLLTDEQQANLVRDQKAKFGAREAEAPEAAPGGGASAVQASPPPPTEAPKDSRGGEKKKTRGAPKGNGKTGDPCDGGE